jgi:hypothetical protein
MVTYDFIKNCTFGSRMGRGIALLVDYRGAPLRDYSIILLRK